MTDTDEVYTQQQAPEPGPDIRALDRLTGTWKITGGAQGTVTYEWMEGGFFLLQHVDLEHHGQRNKGIEVIGHLKPFGEPPSEEIRSRFYGNMGDTLDYVYELEDNTLTGEWVYPGGGGYESTATRV